MVKAFNTILASRHADPTEGGTPLDAFIAGDDAAAKQKSGELASSLGYRVVDAGSLRMARSLEEMAFLNITLNAANGWPWQSGLKLVGPTGGADEHRPGPPQPRRAVRRRPRPAERFYTEVFGMDVAAREPRANAAFLRLPRSGNHHDLGLFGVGARGAQASRRDRPLPPGLAGRHHRRARAGPRRCSTHGRYTGESSHGATKSVYGADPDGNEFEVMWMLPREAGAIRERRPRRPPRPAPAS